MEPATIAIFLGALVGLLACIGLGYWLGSRSPQAQLREALAARQQLESEARQLAAADAGKAAEIAALKHRLVDQQKDHEAGTGRLKEFLAEAQKQLGVSFEAASARILDEKTAKFTATNREKLDELLKPFRERLVEFQKKVDDVYGNETRERAALKNELERLMKLNQQVSDDAKNLTRALKGESKTQGSWGEFVLDKTLELSGLERGIHYTTQDSHTDEDGKRLQTDVIVHLPDDRHLIVDSKVSLTAFERYVNATDDDAREQALAAHLASMEVHVRQLADKNYPKLFGARTLDFTLMFVPVEAAFLAAVQAAPQLYDDAWKRKIVIVGPTTLLATLRVADKIWQMDKQNRNAEEIARVAGTLYDKFVGFAEDLEAARAAVSRSGRSLDEAVKKLTDGRGNIVGTVTRLRKLGAKVGKDMPDTLLEASDDEPADEPPVPDRDGPRPH